MNQNESLSPKQIVIPLKPKQNFDPVPKTDNSDSNSFNEQESQENLLPKMRGKTLLVKDPSTLSLERAREQFAELRKLYDPAAVFSSFSAAIIALKKALRPKFYRRNFRIKRTYK